MHKFRGSAFKALAGTTMINLCLVGALAYAYQGDNWTSIRKFGDNFSIAGCQKAMLPEGWILKKAEPEAAVAPSQLPSSVAPSEPHREHWER